MALDHYVSQVHLKRFYSPALGELLYAIRKSDLKRFTPNAKSVCRIDEGNTNQYLSEPRIIEEFLKTVEGRYNRAVSALESGNPDRHSIYVVSGFTAYVLTCSPAAIRIHSVPLRGALEMATQILERTGEIPAPPSELGGGTLTELLESGKVVLGIDPKYPQAVGIASIFQKIAMLGNGRWEILVNDHTDCPFFTSDFPVTVEAAADSSVLNWIVPLSPRIAARMRSGSKRSRDDTNFDFRGFSWDRRAVTRHQAVEINRLLVRSAEDTVFFSDDQAWITRFIAKNRHFRVDAENFHGPVAGGVGQVSRLAILPFKRA